MRKRCVLERLTRLFLPRKWRLVWMHDAWRKLYMTFALYILFKGEMYFKIDFCQDEKKKNENLAFFLWKVLQVWKKCLPLHPLNESSALARPEGKSSLTDLHKQTSSTGSESCHALLWHDLGTEKWTVNLRIERRKGAQTWLRTVVLGQITESLFFLKGFQRYIFLQWRVWSWLRMNASYRLNTCKSRGSMELACKFRWRPAHGWVTRIQPSAQ